MDFTYMKMTIASFLPIKFNALKNWIAYNINFYQKLNQLLCSFFHYLMSYRRESAHALIPSRLFVSSFAMLKKGSFCSWQRAQLHRQAEKFSDVYSPVVGTGRN
jgi:hypothetical protein